MAESKRQRFVRLVNPRVTRAQRDIRLIGNLSNRSYYEFSDDDVKKIIRALEDEVRTVKNRFEHAQDAQGSGFSIE